MAGACLPGSRTEHRHQHRHHHLLLLRWLRRRRWWQQHWHHGWWRPRRLRLLHRSWLALPPRRQRRLPRSHQSKGKTTGRRRKESTTLRTTDGTKLKWTMRCAWRDTQCSTYVHSSRIFQPAAAPQTRQAAQTDRTACTYQAARALLACEGTHHATSCGGCGRPGFRAVSGAPASAGQPLEPFSVRSS